MRLCDGRFAKTHLTAYATRAMSSTTHARGAALAKVCALTLDAEKQGCISVPVAALRVALDAVDVEGLANPRPAPVCNIGSRRILATRASAHDGENVARS